MKKRAKKSAGRPELPASQKRKPIGIPFSDDEMAAIRAAAQAANLPVSVFIRQSVLNAIHG